MEEEEGEEEEESLKELEPEEEEIAMTSGCWRIGVFLCYLAWEEDEFAVKRDDSG